MAQGRIRLSEQVHECLGLLSRPPGNQFARMLFALGNHPVQVMEILFHHTFPQVIQYPVRIFGGEGTVELRPLHQLVLLGTEKVIQHPLVRSHVVLHYPVTVFPILLAQLHGRFRFVPFKEAQLRCHLALRLAHALDERVDIVDTVHPDGMVRNPVDIILSVKGCQFERLACLCVSSLTVVHVQTHAHALFVQRHHDRPALAADTVHRCSPARRAATASVPTIGCLCPLP